MSADNEEIIVFFWFRFQTGNAEETFGIWERQREGEHINALFRQCIYVASPNAVFSKILNELRRKTDCNSCGKLLENHFRHLKLYSNPPSWLARSCCHMGTFWKTKSWSSHFWHNRPFRLCHVGLHYQKRLKFMIWIWVKKDMRIPIYFPLSRIALAQRNIH